MLNNDNADNATITIKLSRGFTAVISAIDKDLAYDAAQNKDVKWSACVGRKRIYAYRSQPGNNKVKLYLGREVLRRVLGRDLEPGESCHFKNDNPLDCTRDNVELLKRNTRSKVSN
jgi:hypothetical protein